jgi:oligoribonuclease NrnB/cAMP/cGMP phosphodiesterase (DHH superfamily)
MLDIAYPLELHKEFEKRVGSLVVVDHHKSNEALRGLPGVTLEMGNSGAVLAWRHFFPGGEVPEILQYVEDRDLWRWALPKSREVSAALGSRPQTFAAWSEIHHLGGLDTLRKEGEAILRFTQQRVASVVKNSFFATIDGVSVPVACATSFGSEVGERLLELHPEAPFAAFFFDIEDGRVWGLRSRADGGADCSAIAKRMGGGGHRNAAGFKVLGKFGGAS